MTDATGAVRARYDYDPYGRITKVNGDLESDFGFTGFYRHQTSGLNLTMYRAYDADLGRWLSRNPLRNAERKQGANLYRHVMNDPINRLDPLGLWTFSLGISGNGQFGILNLNVNIGFVVDGHGHFGFYDTGAAGAGAGTGVSAGVSLAGSNGDSICDLAGPFGYGSGGGGAGPDIAIDGFTGPGSHGQNVSGGGLTIGVGAGGGAASGVSQTWIHPFF